MKSGRALTMAAPRDASWFTSHGRGSKFHIVVGGVMACRAHSKGQTSGHPVIKELAIPAMEVEPSRRCARAGCRGRWPDYKPVPNVLFQFPSTPGPTIDERRATAAHRRQQARALVAANKPARRGRGS